jgi:hypothetical protein
MRSIATWIILIAAATLTAQAADPPATRPSIPLLRSDAKAGVPFIVDGIVRTTATDGYGFHFATDGAHSFVSLFDPHDGTPLYLSDGQQTLIYELSDQRIVRIPNSAAIVMIGWDAKAPRPLSFDFSVNYTTGQLDSAKTASSFTAIADFLASDAKLEQFDRDDGSELFAVQGANGRIDAVQIPRGELKWARFFSARADEKAYHVEMEVKFGAVPSAAVRLPDVAALRRHIKVVDLDEQRMVTLVKALKSGVASTVKLALAGGEPIRAEMDRGLVGLDWEDLRERDRTFGAEYRAALTEQGFLYRVGDLATTQPAALLQPR